MIQQEWHRNGTFRVLRDRILPGCAAGFNHPSMPLPHGGAGDMGAAPPQPPPKEKPKKRRKKKKADDGDSAQSQPLPPSMPSQTMLSTFVSMMTRRHMRAAPPLRSVLFSFFLSLSFSHSFPRQYAPPWNAEFGKIFQFSSEFRKSIFCCLFLLSLSWFSCSQLLFVSVGFLFLIIYCFLVKKKKKIQIGHTAALYPWALLHFPWSCLAHHQQLHHPNTTRNSVQDKHCYKCITRTALSYLCDCLQLYTPSSTRPSASDMLGLQTTRTRLSTVGSHTFSIMAWPSPSSLTETLSGLVQV